MLRLPAPGGSRFFTVLCFTHLPSPSEPLARASFAAFLPSPLRDWVLFLHSTIHFLYWSFYQFSEVDLYETDGT